MKGQARAAVAQAREHCEDVEFSPMDATRADLEFTAEVLQIALDEGATTSGRANRAWALIGTTRRASTVGQTTGPPAEKAYAVEPVGVAATTPSPPHRDSGRPSTSV